MQCGKQGQNPQMVKYPQPIGKKTDPAKRPNFYRRQAPRINRNGKP